MHENVHDFKTTKMTIFSIAVHTNTTRDEYERLGTDRACAFCSTNNIAKRASPVCTEALIFICAMMK